MSHERNTPALRGSAKEGNLDFSLLKVGRVMLNCGPSAMPN